MFGLGHDENENIKVVVDKSIVKDAIDKNLDLVGAIDQGTSSSRFVVFTKLGRMAASAQREHTQIFPTDEEKVGWHEHDPIEIWNSVVSCIDAVARALKNNGINLEKRRLKAVGITNQRETTIAWNNATGAPYYNAIVWDCLRTGDIAADIARGDVNMFRAKTGLPLASYFAGTKVRWLLDNVAELEADLKDPTKREHVRFGTVDTWLVYQLTGTSSRAKGPSNSGGIFVTDVTNASRWLFFNLHTGEWDPGLVKEICFPHAVPMSVLPEIRSSSEVYAICVKSCGVNALHEVPIASILGDQQAALVGQCAFLPGEAKNTYGTGLFLMMNTGTEIVPSTHGLLTTVAYQLGPEEPIHYALEGSISHSGSTIQWLRDQLNIISDAAESETMARTIEHNDGVYFVPAFAGLFAPHWRSDARACIVGMTASCHKGHICRAALEAAAYQTKEVFDAIYADSNVPLKALKVDGGGIANNLLMQFQADMLDIDVIQPIVLETTSMGAAFAAGLAVGVWKDVDEVRKLWAVAKIFTPSMTENERQINWNGWQKAVAKSVGWIDEKVHPGEIDDAYDTADEWDELAASELVDNEVKAKASPVSAPPSETRFSATTVIVASVCALAFGVLVGRARK
jgi:glycerol kinase